MTRGYSLVDRAGVLDQEANCEVVERANKALFKDMLERVLAG